MKHTVHEEVLRNISTMEEQPTGVDIFSMQPTQENIDEFFRYVQDIHGLLHETVEFLKRNTYPREVADIFQTVDLAKIGSGHNWVPSRFQRQYMRIAAPVSTAVQITCMLGSPFIVTIPPVVPPLFWNVWDWPDQSSFVLDATASANTMKVWVRYTNVP